MKFVCIHGHFYQPPRENPYTEIINRQDSAHPFHNWNEVIGFQSYGPNAYARLLNDKGKIINILNNYQYISFNFGPTLLSWLKRELRNIYDDILLADKKSIELFEGHGSAIAQVYNHVIMPFATRKDKELQVKWGIKDFISHFDRKPEGMWLAETAVDTESLEVLAENGIKFTILSPYQAKEIREEYEEHFHPIQKEHLNTNKPYLVELPSGKSIVIFFYNGDFAHQLSFGDLLKNGDAFFGKIRNHFNFNNRDYEILNVALDGETFGHHHRNGEMALAYCLDKIRSSKDIQLVNYGRFLDVYRVTTRVRIHERTAWSCAHGIERWNSNCGCRGGGEATWTQEWRGPLRHALSKLNQKADEFFYKMVEPYFNNVDEVLYDYIEVINNRSHNFSYIFFSRYSKKKLADSDIITLTRLFEMKRNTQLMFTSCGWFFTELSGIETVQILMYADRAIQIYESLSEDQSVIKEFLILLRAAKSNISEYKDAENIYKRWVRPNRQSLTQIAMLNALIFAIDSDGSVLDKNLPKAELQNAKRYEMGYIRALKGTIVIESNITFSKRYFCFTLFQLSRANFLGYYTIDTEPFENPADKFDLMDEESLGNITAMLDKVKKKYQKTFSTASLLPEYQALVLEIISNKEEHIVESQMEDVFKRNYPLAMQYLQSNIKLPLFLKNILDFHLLESLKKNLVEKNYKLPRLTQIVQDILKWKVSFDHELDRLQLLLGYLLSHELLRLKQSPTKEETLKDVLNVIDLVNSLKIHFDLWSSQNILLHILSENKIQYLQYKKDTHQIYQHLQKVSEFLNIDLDHVLHQ